MKKTAIHIVAFILVILFGSFAWAQLGPSRPAIICDAPASVCATITDLGGGHKGLDVNGTFTGTITGTVNQGTAGSQSWRQWLYEPTGGNAMGYFLDPAGNYNLRTYSGLQGPDFTGTQQVVSSRRILTLSGGNPDGVVTYGLYTYDEMISELSESATDFGTNPCGGCGGIYAFANARSVSPTYTHETAGGEGSDDPMVMDLHGGLHVHLYDNSGAEFGLVGNPMYVVVNSITAALPAGTNVIGHVINDASTAVIGHVIADTGSTTAVTGNVTVIQPTGSNLHTVIDSGTVTTVTSLTQMNGQAISMGTGTRDAGTQRVTIATNDSVPVSAASLPLPTGAATSANQTNGNEITQVSTINRGTEQTATLSAVGTFNFSPASSTSIDTSGYGYLLVNISTTGSPSVVQLSGTSDGGAATYFVPPNTMTENSGGINYSTGGNFYVVGIYKTWTLALTTLSGGSSPTVTVKATPVNAPMMPVTPTSVLANLNGSTNTIGKVGIDQTTDGTTNKVYVGNTPAITCALCALEAGGHLATIDSHIPANGGATAANSIPVVGSTLTLAATGQQAVTASAVALPSNTAREVCISSLQAGTQVVYFGVSGVTTSTGQELLQGGKECRPVANSNQIYVIAGSTGSTVAYEVYQ